MKKFLNKFVFLFVLLIGILISLTISSFAATSVKVEKKSVDYNGAIISVSAEKDMKEVCLYMKNSEGKYILFYRDTRVNSNSKQYFIGKERLNKDSETEYKAVVTYTDGERESSEGSSIDIIPEKPELSNSPSSSPSVSVALSSTPSPSVSPSNSNTPTPSNSTEPSSSVSPSSTTTSRPTSSPSPSSSSTPEVNEEVSLNKKTLKLGLNNKKTEKLVATIKNGKSGSKITWSTSNKNVAKVDSNGKITAVASGSAKITVKTSSGAKASCTVTVSANTNTTEILFVGNSKTYVGNIPAKFSGLAKKAGKKVTVSSATLGGKSLSGLASTTTWKDKITGRSIKTVLTEKAYDIVIMQEATYNNIGSYNTYLNGAKKLKGVVQNKNKNVKIYLRQPWVYKRSSSSQINTAYNNTVKVAKAIGADLIYCGRTLYKGESSLKKDFIRNWSNDTNHQTDLGAYAAACACYAAVYKESPEKVNYSASIATSTATKVRKLAWQVYKENSK